MTTFQLELLITFRLVMGKKKSPKTSCLHFGISLPDLLLVGAVRQFYRDYAEEHCLVQEGDGVCLGSADGNTSTV